MAGLGRPVRLRVARNIVRRVSLPKSKAMSRFWFGRRLHKFSRLKVKLCGGWRNRTLFDDGLVFMIKFTTSAAGSAAESACRRVTIRLRMRANGYLIARLGGNTGSVHMLMVWRLDHAVRVWTVGRIGKRHLTEIAVRFRLA